MIITATEFKNNFGHYLAMAETEDIIITKYGKPYRTVSNFGREKIELMKELAGILPPGISFEDAMAERAGKHPLG